MEDELKTAVAAFVTPYIKDQYRILNVAAAVEELSAACPGVDRERIADSLRRYAASQGVMMLLKPIRRSA